jgi:uncharacterized membrane protein YdbT with pleckstrin-like domain
MPRAKDLDNVAPDDPIIRSNTSTVSKPLISSDTDQVVEILGPTKHSFSALLVKPHVFNFEERNEHEDILLVARQHWFTNVGWILVTIILILFQVFLFSYVSLSAFLPANYQFVATVFWYLATFAYSFEKFLSWYFNVYIITTERIVDIDFNNLLVKKYSEAQLTMIQDVSSSVIGAIPTVFNFGNVLIQTASEVNQLVFERVPNPEKIIKVLQGLRETNEAHQEAHH